MALLYRKQIRDDAIRFLGDGYNGFNQTLGRLSPYFGITPFEIDFSPTSNNFAQCYLEPTPEAIEKSSIIEYPGATLYTTEAQDLGDPKGIPYFGDVILAMDLHVRIREGAERNTEDLMDAAEASVLTVLNYPGNTWTPGVLLTRKSKTSRLPVFPLGDGFHQVIRIELIFGSASQSF